MDVLAPADPVFGTISADQVEEGDPKWKTRVTLTFITVVESQIVPGEHLGQADGGLQVFNTAYINIKAP